MKHVIALSFALLAVTPPTASATDDVMIVYDGSNSMWGQIEGVPKIEIAREAMADLVESWPQSTNLGLMAYGHRRAGDCADIELMVKPGSVDKNAFLQIVNAITPRGRTPLTAAVAQAAEFLSYRDNPATVVLVSDGVETCQADPCALAAQLERQGVAFTAHVIGFDLSSEEHEQLACIAENTGGIFVPAENAGELRAAMTQVQKVIESDRVVEPEPAAEPQTPEQTISAPASVTFGTEFTVTWGKTVNPSDWVTIVPVGAKEGAFLSYERVKSKDSVALKAPAEPGLYEVRYVLDEGRKTLASAPVEVVEAEQTVSAPASVTFGTEFTVTWGKTITPGDWVTIVPVGAKEGAFLSYKRVKKEDSVALKAPAEPGLYEVRYVLDEGRKTLASTPVEVVATEQTVSAPAIIRAESTFAVTWGVTVNPSDWVTIVPAGAKEGAFLSYKRVKKEDSVTLKAPAEPGLYEVRYVLDAGRKTLASAAVEIVAADAPLDSGAGLSVPATAAPGATITVSWTIAADDVDRRVALAKADAPDFTWVSAHRVGAEQTTEITLPSAPGQYEIRFLDIPGQSVLGRATITVGE